MRKQRNGKEKKKGISYSIFYRDQIMYAEYLESIPDDFMEEWIMMICPKGKRCMVTSGNGETVARSRGGHVIGRFQSILPNGSK